MEDIKAMSPYMKGYIEKFGEYIITLESATDPINEIDIEKIIESVT